MKYHLALATASLLLSMPAVLAGEADVFVPIDTAPASDRWEFSLTPYLFLIGLEGDLDIGPLSGSIDYDLGDILDDLDGLFILAGEARRGRFSLQGDFLYLGVSPSGTTQRPGYDRAKLEFDAIVVTGLAAYRVWEEPSGFLEFGAGARVLSVDTDLRLIDTDGPLGGRLPDLASSSSSTVVDGIVAVRFVRQLDEKWSVRFYGDIGTGDSDLTWQIWANVGYALNDRTTILAGWRHLAYEFEEGRADLDISFSGPQIGVAIAF